MRREDYSPAVQRALTEGDRWGVEQHGDELAPFCALLEALRPRHVLEIGFRRGGTLAVWHALSSGNALGIDLPDDFSEARARELMDAYAPRLFVMLHDSHDEATLRDVRSVLQGEPLDLLFIDGDHSAEGVARDLEMYEPLVRPGGVVAFHDIQPHPGSIGVHEMWKRLRQDRETTEFNIGAEWGGIGVTYAEVAA